MNLREQLFVQFPKALISVAASTCHPERARPSAQDHDRYSSGQSDAVARAEDDTRKVNHRATPSDDDTSRLYGRDRGGRGQPHGWMRRAIEELHCLSLPGDPRHAGTD